RPARERRRPRKPGGGRAPGHWRGLLPGWQRASHSSDILWRRAGSIQEHDRTLTPSRPRGCSRQPQGTVPGGRGGPGGRRGNARQELGGDWWMTAAVSPLMIQRTASGPKLPPESNLILSQGVVAPEREGNRESHGTDRDRQGAPPEPVPHHAPHPP